MAETRAALGRREEAARGVCRICSSGRAGSGLGPARRRSLLGGPATTEDDGMRRGSATALELEACGTRRIRHSLDAPVILVPGAIEHERCDAPLSGLPGDQLTHSLPGGDVA